MNIEDMLAKDGIIPRLKAEDKKQALQALATRAETATGASAQEIFAALLQRERLSSTSLGRGIAIPHVKLPRVKAITCLFARRNRRAAIISRHWRAFRGSFAIRRRSTACAVPATWTASIAF